MDDAVTDPKVQLAFVRPTITYRIRAIPRDGMSVDELRDKMEALGNPILAERDGSLIVREVREDSDRWGCLYCLSEGRTSLCDSEDEFRTHLDQEHAGWDERT